MWYPVSLSEYESLITIVAVVLGGIGAYWKFFRGKTFHPRLEPVVAAAQVVDERDRRYLSVVCKIKNVGLSRININHRASSLRIIPPRIVFSEAISEVDWAPKALLAVDVFTSHMWIEGGETIEDHHLFLLPTDLSFAYKVELRVTRKKRFRWVPKANSWVHHMITEGSGKKLQPPEEKNG
jgi:hypothetical protein